MGNKFSSTEMKFLLGMGSVLALRQLGLLIVMPFLAIYGKELAYSTPGLIGIAIGVYGLTQAVFQIPYGNLSDKYGRKVMILIGLFVFVLGLFLGYLAKDIYVFILARILQGSGAIMAVAYAWVGDSIKEEHRNKGMSIIGMLVGMSATLAFLGGPILHRWLSVPEMFLVCAFLVGIAWLYILIFLKEDKANKSSFAAKERVAIITYFRDKKLLKLFAGGFINNYILVSQFYVIPLLLENSLGADGLWKVFAPATLIAIVVMRLAAKYADAGYFNTAALSSFAVISLGALAYYTGSALLIGIGTTCFMVGYMCLVTLLPASISRQSEKDTRGKLTGVFNTVQFIGSFMGGALTGFLWGINPGYSITFLVVIGLVGALVIHNTEEGRTLKQALK